LESRKITALDELKNLLVCDKIKSTLSEACLRHVISVESAQDTWLKKRELTEAIDRYYDSYITGRKSLELSH